MDSSKKEPVQVYHLSVTGPLEMVLVQKKGQQHLKTMLVSVQTATVRAQAMGQGTCAIALKVMRATLIFPKAVKVSISSNNLVVNLKSQEIKVTNGKNNFKHQIIIAVTERTTQKNYLSLALGYCTYIE